MPEVSARTGARGLVVPVSVDEVQGIVNFELTVTFNPAVIQARAAEAGELTSGWMIEPHIDNEKGEIKVTAVGYPELLPGRGNLANLIFDVVGSLGESTALTFTHCKLTDAQMAEIPRQTEDDNLTIVDLLNGVANSIIVNPNGPGRRIIPLQPKVEN